MNEALKTIMEVRKEEHMVSPAGDSKPIFRTAQFLKPIANQPLSELLPKASVFENDYQELPLKIHFNGWHQTQNKWVQWVDALKLKYESVWKKAGIFEAIMTTKCFISRNKDLLFGVVEKWCYETNTFVFPWGEATITLEDIMVLGGYPILGDSVFTSVDNNHEMKEVEKKLILARQQPLRRYKNKSTVAAWMDIFINNKGTSDIEHEAFLVAWLSFFVFPQNGTKLFLIQVSCFPIAIQLARGNPIALAPAVLASIYRDLTLLVGLTKLSLDSDQLPLEVNLQSPMYLVQIWVWERFTNLQPEPNSINHGDPLLFKWDKVKALKIDNVRLTLNLAVDDFLWRPYVRYADKCELFYPKVETWVLETDLEKELLSFVTCLRISELVGIDTIEQYLPHRVAMQFGIDQDVPGFVPRFNQSKATAWENYCRPIPDENLCLPSRFFEADVTMRYAKWWKQSVLGHCDFVNTIVRRKRSASSSKHAPRVGKAIRSCNDAVVSPKPVETVSFIKSYDNASKARNDDDIDAGANGSKTVPSGNVVQDCLEDDENIHADDPANFPPNIHAENIQASSADYGNSEKTLPLKKPFGKDNIEPSIGGLDEGFEDANGNKESMFFGSRVCQSVTEGESCSLPSEIEDMDLEQRISRLERVVAKLKKARLKLN